MKEEKQGYHQLIVHQKADELAFLIYKITRDYPQEEIFGLVTQMRRCAVSVPANIAEGYTRKGPKDKAHFYNIAQGSLVELEYYIEFSYRLGYIKEAQLKELITRKDEVGRLLHGFIKSVKTDR